MSSFVISGVRSVAGKITRSALDTRSSRPPASMIVASALAIPKFYGNRLVVCSMKLRLLAGAAVLALAFTTGSASAAPSFSAHGSAEQVYVTGLAPNAKMSLLDPAGKVIASQKADSLGGLLFRGVKPGSGYRVRLGKAGEKSDALTVLSNQPAPPSTDAYNQAIPSDGYGYMTTRDGTKLA